MSLRGTLALLLLASLMLAPLSGAWAQEVLETTLPEVPQEPVVPEEIPEPEELLVSPEETPSRTISDESGDVTAPTIIQAKALYNPTERSAGPKSKIKEGLTIIQINISDELNESPDVRVDFSLLGGSSSVRPNEGISSLFNKYIYYDGPAITVPDGTYYLPYTASDPHGNTVAGTVPITIDESPPSIENFVVSYPAGKTAATSTDTLTLSGSFSDLSSPETTKVLGALLYEYDEAGLPAYFVPTDVGGWFVPDVQSVAVGTFSFELPIASALLENSFKPNAKTFDIVFYVQDGAGLITTATSTRLLIGDSVAATTTGVSNVLFLPGIKGSRLYSGEARCVLSLCNNKLWDPISSEDVRDLYLTPEGKSSRSDIYAKEGDIIDAIPGKRIYASFIEDMNELQASTTYNGGDFKWRAAAYDWRLSLDDIVTNGVEREGKIYYEEASSTPYIEQTLRELAATSTTNKVTIIAHSNGGLVAKALLQKLGDAETARLVDKIIFVGVPQTGAPQALGGLLFGDREGLPLDWLPAIATPAVARGLAEYSPMAYHLMPSARYLSDVQDYNHSVIGFSGSHLYKAEQDAYGSSVDTVTELDNFLTARDGGRTKPEANDSSSANILSSDLITYANTTHDSLDSWVPPTGVSLYQIAGWGTNTISGIDFYDEQKVLGINTGYKKQYRPIFVEDGDGVVPVPSALMISEGTDVKRYWIDLHAAKKDHGTMLETADLRSFISKVLTDSLNQLPSLISVSQPKSEPSEKKLIFQLHSPLTLGLYDANGNFTGLNTDGSVSESIPGTEYGEFGEVKYLIAPTGNEYQLVMLGQSDGTFSLDIQEQTGNTTTSSATIADIPTTSSTIAKLTITNGVADASSLKVDTDGDGITDTTVSAQVGETVNYGPGETAVSDSTASGSSSNYKQVATTTTSAMIATVLTPFIPAVSTIAALTKVLKADIANVATAEATPSAIQVQEMATTSPDLSQTASAYSAFALVADSIGELLYNIWQELTVFLKNILNWLN